MKESLEGGLLYTWEMSNLFKQTYATFLDISTLLQLTKHISTGSFETGKKMGSNL